MQPDIGPQPAPPPPLGPRGKCLLWGDPHVKVFDQPSVTNFLPVTFLFNGDYWLVKSGRIWIQGRYEATEWTNGKASLHGIAVGGPFLNHNKIIIGPKTGKVYYNNQQILTHMPGSFSVPGLFQAIYHDKGVKLDSSMQEHLWYVRLDLPDRVTIIVNRWAKHIDAEITMPSVRSQDGHFGNFNGNLADDTKDQILARLPGQVSRRHDLFPPTHFNTDRPQPYTMQDCNPQLLSQAKKQCHQDNRAVSEALVSACVLDVCRNGIQFAAEDAATEKSARRLQQKDSAIAVAATPADPIVL